MATDTHRMVDAVWRIESPRLIAGLTRMTGDLGTAEDLAQDALITALEQWPREGVPSNPGAWLMAVAKRRAIDGFRRNETLARKQQLIGRDLDQQQTRSGERLVEEAVDEIGDDLLGLMFMTCSPVLSTDARVALTLRTLAGLSTDEIARAFLASEPTIAQRIVRAKKTLKDKQVEFEVPAGAELHERLPTVLEVVYLIFNEGYSATSGDDWMRPDLCFDALRLGRVLVGLVPREPEAHGLLALMEMQASRIKARTGRDGEPVLLLDQDRALWDRLLIGRGFESLERAQGLDDTLGSYTLQAAIAACHARALDPAETDWARIAALYALLGRLMPSPVIELNRAVAVGMADGPAAGLTITDDLLDEPALADYHLLSSVRGDLLARLGRDDEARAEFEHAARMTRNERERRLLEDRARTLARTRDLQTPGSTWEK